MNKNMLESAMKAFGDTGETLSNYLNISRSTFSLKLNGKNDFTLSEMTAIKQRYSLSCEQIDAIFFSL